MNDAQITPEIITQLVAGFYAKAREDDVLGPVFVAVVPDDLWLAHLEKIEGFWASMVLGTREYDGRLLLKHNSLKDNHSLAPAHFERWLALWAETARDVCSPYAARIFIDRAERIARSMQLALFFDAAEVDKMRP